MLDVLEDLVCTIGEEIKYRENIVRHKKSLEASLWGLEEQIRLPENSGAEDQDEINAQINFTRSKIANCKQLLLKHTEKMKKFLDSYKLSDELTKQK